MDQRIPDTDRGQAAALAAVVFPLEMGQVSSSTTFAS